MRLGGPVAPDSIEPQDLFNGAHEGFFRPLAEGQAGLCPMERPAFFTVPVSLAFFLWAGTVGLVHHWDKSDRWSIRFSINKKWG